MENSAAKLKAAVVSAAICMLCVGLMFFGTGCPFPPVTPCTMNADCEDELFCNGTETCVDADCQAGTDPCEEGETCDEDNDQCVVEGCLDDAYCADDEFCDTQTGECVTNENLYEVTKVDADYEARVHYLDVPGHMNCTVCHHVADEVTGEPDATGQACVPCHSDDPNGVNSFKSVAHDLNESGDGCRGCHEDETTEEGLWDCSFCHPDAL